LERKRKSSDEQIAEQEAIKSRLQARDNELKAKISDVDSKIKELKEAKKQKELNDLMIEIKKSGKTPEEVMTALKLSNQAAK
jgi:hypothetical protein